MVDIIGWLTEPLAYDFMVRAIIATAVSSFLCALLSCWLVLIGWSLLGDAVSHAVLPGVALAYLFGLPFFLGALTFGFLAVVLVGGLSSTSRIKEDASIGIVFTTLFAFGLVLISVIPSHIDLNHIIFGNVLGVSQNELIQICALAAITATALLLKRRDLTLWAFDPVHTHVIGISARYLRALLLIALSLTAVVSLQVVGVVLVVAMLVIPGATAQLLTDSFTRMLWLAPTIAVGCSLLGLNLAWWLDASPGGLVVLTQGIAFLGVYLFSPRHGMISKFRVSREPSQVVKGSNAANGH